MKKLLRAIECFGAGVLLLFVFFFITGLIPDAWSQASQWIQSLGGIPDVKLITSIPNGNTIVYDSANKWWTNGTVTASGTNNSVQVNGTPVTNPNLTNSATAVWGSSGVNVTVEPTNVVNNQIAAGAAIAQSKIGSGLWPTNYLGAGAADAGTFLRGDLMWTNSIQGPLFVSTVVSAGSATFTNGVTILGAGTLVVDLVKANVLSITNSITLGPLTDQLYAFVMGTNMTAQTNGSRVTINSSGSGAGGATNAAGSNNEVQWRNPTNGFFAADSRFVYDNTNGILAVSRLDVDRIDHSEKALGSIGNGGTASLLSGTNIYMATFTGAGAFVDLTNSPATGRSAWRQLVGTNASGGILILTNKVAGVVTALYDEQNKANIFTITNQANDAFTITYRSSLGVWSRVDVTTPVSSGTGSFNFTDLNLNQFTTNSGNSYVKPGGLLTNVVTAGTVASATTNTDGTASTFVVLDATKKQVSTGTSAMLATTLSDEDGQGAVTFSTGALTTNQFNLTSTNSGTVLSGNTTNSGQVVFKVAAQSTNLDWAATASPVQGFTSATNFTNAFQNTPPPVGAIAYYSISNSSASKITNFFAGNNQATNNFSVHDGGQTNSHAVAANSIANFSWYYDGTRYQFTVDEVTTAGGGTGSFNFTDLNLNQFTTNSGNSYIKPGALLTNMVESGLSVSGPTTNNGLRVESVATASTNLDWSNTAKPSQNFVAAADFTNVFQNVPPPVGAGVFYYASNSSGAPITMWFSPNNQATNNFAVRYKSQLLSYPVAAGSAAYFKWQYDGSKYQIVEIQDAATGSSGPAVVATNAVVSGLTLNGNTTNTVVGNNNFWQNSATGVAQGVAGTGSGSVVRSTAALATNLFSLAGTNSGGSLSANTTNNGQLVFPILAQSTNLDWAATVAPVQGFTSATNFTNAFQNTPPPVGATAYYSVSNSATVPIIVNFAINNQATNNYSIHDKGRILSNTVAPASIANYSWFYDGSRYQVTIDNFSVVTNTSYAGGTAYTMTTTSAQVAFGTTSPSVTLTNAGTYILFSSGNVSYKGATYATNADFILKLRVTSGTPADILNSSRTNHLSIVTTVTNSFGSVKLPTVYYTGAANDVIQMFGNCVSLPTAGSIVVDQAEIVALKVY
jgi:hypothetical protein